MILATPDWPTLEQAIAGILEEETRLASKDSTNQLHGDNRAALSQTRTSTFPSSDQANTSRFGYKRRSKVLCDHCKKPGHAKKDCFELVGYPPGWQQRQINKYYMANNHDKKQDRAHFTSSTQGLSPKALQALEEFKAKLMSATAEVPHEASSSSVKEGSEVKKDTWDWN